MRTKETKKRILAALLALVMAVSTWMPTEQVKAEVILPNATNTTFENARQLLFNSSVAEKTTDGDSMRYYKFSLDQASEFVVRGKRDSRKIVISVYDQEQTKVWSTDHYGWYGDAFSSSIYLTGGSYYLKMETWGDFNFTASANALSESFAETQDNNNDMIDTASAIELKSKYKGVLALNDQIDYYTFNVPVKGKINFNTLNSTNGSLSYIFYDRNLNMVYNFNLGGGYNATQSFEIVGGKYYLAVTQENIGNGVGSYNFSMDYTASAPTKPNISSVKNKSGRKMAVKWTSVSGVSGYELQYAVSSNFKKGLVKKNISSNKASATYSKLKKGKTYYVRVRSYITVNGKKVYGSWSSKKSVKIKK